MRTACFGHPRVPPDDVLLDRLDGDVLHGVFVALEVDQEGRRARGNELGAPERPLVPFRRHKRIATSLQPPTRVYWSVLAVVPKQKIKTRHKAVQRLSMA